MTDQECPFCNPGPGAKVLENELAFVILDKYPANPFHSLIVTKRHVESAFDLKGEEAAAVMELAYNLKAALSKLNNPPDGYNLGVNVGKDAGQAVFHVHFHFIPRWKEDESKQGKGVRCVGANSQEAIRKQMPRVKSNRKKLKELLSNSSLDEF